MGEGPESILIVDFGSQYTQLIARRIREAGVWCEVIPPGGARNAFDRMGPRGIVLSGGPASVRDEGAPGTDEALLGEGVPVLGICYGLQWMTAVLGGEVVPGTEREYGRSEMTVADSGALLDGVAACSVAWMSHGDRVETLAPGWRLLARSEDCPVAAAGDEDARLFGLQFHPEVTHTAQGRQVLANFLGPICGCAGDWEVAGLIEGKVQAIRDQVGDSGEILLGLSGGVDSSVAALLMHRAVGGRLHCVFVDNGLLRKGERDEVESTFGSASGFGLDLTVVDASERFLDELHQVDDPEAKRKIIGRVFVEVFQEEAQRFDAAHFLGQGTLYPDVIESESYFGGPSAVIKSHHNVGGLPDSLGMALVEPLRDLFKDEVRELGRALDLPEHLVSRQPFPGPGLAVRHPGALTRGSLEHLREADAIVREEIHAAGLAEQLWQFFVVLLPVRSVGVMGDARTFERACSVRMVKSTDAMTADWFIPEPDVVQRIATRIVNEVPGINRVLWDVTSKPPGTIEWE